MGKLSESLKKVHLKVHFLKAKKKYSIGLYTGGVKMSDWTNLSPEEKRIALTKEWYVRWSFRNPETHKLERQTNIKGGANYHKTKRDRLNILKTLQRNLQELLHAGYTPKDIEFQSAALEYNINDEKSYTVTEALDYALKSRKRTTESRTYNGYRLEAEKFKKYLKKHNLLDADIKKINRRVVINYLNEVLKNTEPRTRNNIRASLSSLFTVLKNDLIIQTNFIKQDIIKVKESSKTDRTIPYELLKKISNHLKKEDPYLLLYIKFVSYNFLRGVEVNRLVLKNIDLKEKRIYFKAKNKITKIKRIPDIMIHELKALNLNQYNQEYFLFTPHGLPGNWDRSDDGRREVFTKRFNRKVKIKFSLGKEYGINSFRHTYITNHFRTLRSKYKLSFNQAIDALMPITGHISKQGLVNYIHKIDADIPDDWSDDIEVIL